MNPDLVELNLYYIGQKTRSGRLAFSHYESNSSNFWFDSRGVFSVTWWHRFYVLGRRSRNSCSQESRITITKKPQKKEKKSENYYTKSRPPSKKAARRVARDESGRLSYRNESARCELMSSINVREGQTPLTQVFTPADGGHEKKIQASLCTMTLIWVVLLAALRVPMYLRTTLLCSYVPVAIYFWEFLYSPLRGRHALLEAPRLERRYLCPTCIYF